MARRYLARPLPDPGERALPEDLARHVGRVLRAKPGDAIRLFDGDGREAPARVLRADRREVVVDVGPAEAVEREPAVRLELAIAVPKGPRADWLFEHGTEVGIAVFRPVLFDRSARAPRNVDRWRRIVAAATGQCDRSRLPEVREPVSLPELLADTDLPLDRFAAEPGAERDLGRSPSSSAAVAIGPEGGLTDEEIELLQSAGFAPRRLGRLTLRVETAALVAAIRILAPEGGHG